MDWRDVEKADRNFVWQPLDEALKNCTKHHIKPNITIRVRNPLHLNFENFIYLDSGDKSGCPTIWGTEYRNRATRFINALAERYARNQQIGSITIDISQTGNTTLFPPTASPTDFNLWIGDKFAQREFGIWVLKKYGGGGPLRDAWGEKVKCPTSAMPFSYAARLNDRSWIDLQEWISQSTAQWITTMFEILRKKSIDMVLFLHIRPDMFATSNPLPDFSMTALRYVRTGIDINPADQWDAITSARLHAAIKRHHLTLQYTNINKTNGTQFVTDASVKARSNTKFAETSSGRTSKSVVLFPSTSIMIDSRSDYSIMKLLKLSNDNLMEENGLQSKELAGYETIVVPAIETIELQTWEILKTFVEHGGRLIVNATAKRLKTVEMDDQPARDIRSWNPLIRGLVKYVDQNTVEGYLNFVAEKLLIHN